MLNYHEMTADQVKKAEDYDREFLFQRERLEDESIESDKVESVQHVIEYLNSDEFSNDDDAFAVFLDAIYNSKELLDNVFDWKAVQLAEKVLK